jgi:hypothetical protein
VRELKREMRQRLQDLSYKASLNAKVVSFDEQLSASRDTWQEELTLHELAIERERELRSLANFNKNLSSDIHELQSTYKTTLEHHQLLEDELASIVPEKSMQTPTLLSSRAVARATEAA